MHSWSSSDDRTSIGFNGDYSGDVRIIRYTDRRDIDGSEVSIPFQHLLEFFLIYLRDKRISELEQADWDELMGMLFR